MVRGRRGLSCFSTLAAEVEPSVSLCYRRALGRFVHSADILSILYILSLIIASFARIQSLILDIVLFYMVSASLTQWHVCHESLIVFDDKPVRMFNTIL